MVGRQGLFPPEPDKWRQNPLFQKREQRVLVKGGRESTKAMAESSSRLSASGGTRGSQGVVGMGSPVPYRDGPLAYEPAVICRCRTKAPRWISWSDENPGQRYYRCIAARTPKDYGFFIWFDNEHTPFVKNLLLDLRDAVRNLQRENAQLKKLNKQDSVDDVWSLRRENGQVMKMNEELQRANEIKDAILKAKLKELEEKDAALVAMATKFSSVSSVGHLAGFL